MTTSSLTAAELNGRPLRVPRQLRFCIGLAVVAALVIAPLVLSPGTNFNITMVFVFVVVGVGLNLLTGNLGQISLGHGAFFALGSYSTAVLLRNGTLDITAILPLVGLVCFLLGYLFALPVLRLAGLQLALATLGLAIITPSAIRRFDDVTQGQEGLIVQAPLVPDILGIAQDQWIYYLCLAVAVVAYAVGSRLTGNMFGRALTGIRDNEVAAATLGVDTAKVKTLVFGLSAGYAGVGGSLYAMAVGFIAPESFGLTLAITFLVLVVVGGMGTQIGVVIGAVFVQFVPAMTADIGQGMSGLAYGMTLILGIALLPSGLVGLARRLFYSVSSPGDVPSIRSMRARQGPARRWARQQKSSRERRDD